MLESSNQISRDVFFTHPAPSIHNGALSSGACNVPIHDRPKLRFGYECQPLTRNPWIKIAVLSIWNFSLFFLSLLLLRVLSSPIKGTIVAPASSELQCSVLDFGCKGDNRTNNQLCITRAITVCRETHGEGIHFVLNFPGGKTRDAPLIYVTAPFNLISDMTLSVGKNAIILGSPYVEDFPTTECLPSFGTCRDHAARDKHARYSPLIWGVNVKNVVITGYDSDSSVIDGNGPMWWRNFRKGMPGSMRGTFDYTRPRLVELMWGENLTVRNIHLKDSAYWTLHFVYSRNILAHGLRITAPFNAKNSDGIDLNSVINAEVFDCSISVGDDGIAIKSGLNERGIQFGMPSQNIHLHDLHIQSKTVAIGTEMSGGVHDVLVENIVMGDSRPENDWYAILIKSMSGRGGVISNVTFRNITTAPNATENRYTPFIYVTTDSHFGGAGDFSHSSGMDTYFRNITFEAFDIGSTKAVAKIEGLRNIPDAIDGLVLRDIKVKEYEIAVECTNAVNVENHFSDDLCIRKERIYYDCKEIHSKHRFANFKQYGEWYIKNNGTDSSMSIQELKEYASRAWKICARMPHQRWAYYK